MKKLIAKFHSQRGATLVEYTLLVGLISVVVVAALILMKPQLTAIWDAVVGAMTTAAGAA